MKLIRVTPDMTITEHDFPEGDFLEQSQALCELIGGGCTTYEEVLPRRLYNLLGFNARPSYGVPGQAVSMLVDEEFLYHSEQEPNPIGSFLYQAGIHGNPINGNILFVGRKWNDGIEICGIKNTVHKKLMKSLQKCKENLRCMEEATDKLKELQVENKAMTRKTPQIRGPKL